MLRFGGGGECVRDFSDFRRAAEIALLLTEEQAERWPMVAASRDSLADEANTYRAKFAPMLGAITIPQAISPRERVPTI